jgi:hypothetical protein
MMAPAPSFFAVAGLSTVWKRVACSTGRPYALQDKVDIVAIRADQAADQKLDYPLRSFATASRSHSRFGIGRRHFPFVVTHPYGQQFPGDC